MHRTTTVTTSLVIGAGAFMFLVSLMDSNPAHVPDLAVGRIVQNMKAPRTGHPFEGEQRFPTIKRPAEPQGRFGTDVYLNYDTSKYTDMDGRIFIPSDAVINELTSPEVEELYHRYIENIQVICPRSRHIGNDRDGGYVVCETYLPKDCLAYSFGSRKDYSFDDGLAAHYSCEVHTFDPADGQTDHQHGELVTFHKFGIAGKDDVIKNIILKTLDSARTLLGHEERPLDLLKIDTEGAEWSAFPQILETKTLDKAHVKLLIVEFHMRFTEMDRDAYMTGLRVLRGIYEAGFRIYYFRIWSNACTRTNPENGKSRALCHEVHFLRT